MKSVPLKLKGALLKFEVYAYSEQKASPFGVRMKKEFAKLHSSGSKSSILAVYRVPSMNKLSP